MTNAEWKRRSRKRLAKYNREYLQRPEVKAKRRERDRLQSIKRRADPALRKKDNAYRRVWLSRRRHTERGRLANRFNQTVYQFRREGDLAMVDALMAARAKAGRGDLVDVNAVKRAMKRGRFAERHSYYNIIAHKRIAARAAAVPIESLLSPDELKWLLDFRTKYRNAPRDRAHSKKYREQNPNWKNGKRYDNALLTARRTCNVEFANALRAAWVKAGRQYLVDPDAVRKSMGLHRVGGRWVKK